MSAERPLLLSIDDEAACRHLVCSIGRTAGYACAEAGTPREFAAAIERRPDVIVLDLTMPDLDGHEVLWELARRQCRAGIVISSGFFDGPIRAAELFARKRGLHLLGRLDKPFSPPALFALLVQARPSPAPRPEDQPPC